MEFKYLMRRYFICMQFARNVHIAAFHIRSSPCTSAIISNKPAFKFELKHAVFVNKVEKNIFSIYTIMTQFTKSDPLYLTFKLNLCISINCQMFYRVRYSKRSRCMIHVKISTTQFIQSKYIDSV